MVQRIPSPGFDYSKVTDRKAYNKRQCLALQEAIEKEIDKYGWEFIFLGANIDAAKEAARFGIDETCAANYHADSVGTAVIYEAMREVVGNVRACRPMNADWKKNVDADYKKRGK